MFIGENFVSNTKVENNPQLNHPEEDTVKFWYISFCFVLPTVSAELHRVPAQVHVIVHSDFLLPFTQNCSCPIVSSFVFLQFSPRVSSGIGH